MTIEEVLVDAAAAVKSARDVLEQKELALRDILPPCFVLHDPLSLTSEDAADFIYTAKNALDDAEDTLNDLIKTANARRLSRDKDEEVKISRKLATAAQNATGIYPTNQLTGGSER